MSATTDRRGAGGVSSRNSFFHQIHRAFRHAESARAHRASPMAHRSPWRSEPLEFVEFILPEDLCREALYELGDLRMVQFVDENEV